MNLRGLVSVSGKPGLFKLIGQNKSGFILESIDAHKMKIVVNMSTSKLASLEDITIFGDGEDLKLVDIFNRMKDGDAAPEPKTADGNALRNYFLKVAPGHDVERVYSSDIKKIISWFSIIKELPLFNEEPSEAGTEPSLASEHKKPIQKVEEKTKAVKTPSVKANVRLPQKSK